ncbi:SUMF1/EgtB/PvdO family nonheme iron enzyme [Flavobacteriaceae bacterium]|nr:SUMF1/EgtB/PvdO family nonheme iron enzyme [Flavobacteriaceae bacterium]MDB4134633.1 SUMF1/EgtB/PvdO family nonheme iron enzyme [Flavobacteriaceae bacterium]MDB4180091.1 SUMF1/EgtB/PvdO family nonheme iron enzyme [Flavobacteriaceae bacterium]MDC0497296.1 SUMF1/EgtB/PvdO family nonheme iron enzyme [Flavobacteriaceae bacterium]MDC0622219.1 SUMF1/EgtB/PvdO family nonheme iron enzyme [Flavobacteriaceae bacterium]
MSNYEIVINDIKLNFKDSKYSTSQLLDNTGLDKNTARDAIKNKTSRSISNYIRFYRLNYAQELLKKGEKNVSEIAYDSGFSSLSYFSKSFKDEFGYSPNASLNNVKLTRQFKTAMISTIQNKKNLSYLVYSILLIFIVILLVPYFNFIDNSEKENKKLMLQDYSKINNLEYNTLLINDTVLLSPKMRNYNISWRTSDNFEWCKLTKLNDSFALFPTKMSSDYNQIKVEQPGKESFQFFTSAKMFKNVKVTLDDKQDEEGIYFPETDLFLANTNYSKSHENLLIKPFYMDRYEVSNKEFKEFVDANGYYREEYWPTKLMHNGTEISFNDVKTSFVDKSNFPSPKNWVQGTYENGKDLFPVSGISWYEASAYAKFRNMSLPSVAEWFYAFDRNRPERALKNANINSYNYTKSRIESNSVNNNGIFDMAGNVREWVSNNIKDDHSKGILGGSFADDTYVPFDFYSQYAWNRSSYNGLRLVKKIEPDNSGEIFYKREKLRNFYENYRTTEKEWNLMESLYMYDKNKISFESVNTSKVTGQEFYCTSSNVISSNMTMPIHHLQANPNVKSKKAIIYFPGSNALYRDKLNYPTSVTAMVNSGIDVIFPEYLSTYSRKDEMKTDIGNTSMNYRDHLITWVKEVRYAVDYAIENGYEPHYFGVSWGGQVGVNILAIEKRFKTGVLFVGGISLDDVREEIQPEKYAARIKTPTLLLNGRYDFYFPYQSSQLPLYNLMDLNDNNKRHVVVDYAHYVPMHIVRDETLKWINNK